MTLEKNDIFLFLFITNRSCEMLSTYGQKREGDWFSKQLTNSLLKLWNTQMTRK